MRSFKADLHNHSCLSPCGSLEMSPNALVARAKAMGIEMLALTDHNSARNLPPFAECARKAGIIPVFGMEVTTVEEVHVVCLFETVPEARAFGKLTEHLLPDIPNMPELFGDQVWVDSHENILGFFEKNLLAATTLSLEDVVDEVLSRDGLVIPAHIDRMAFSAVSQLGFLPDLPYSAVEVIRIPCGYETHGKTLIRNSDAHQLQSVGRRSFSFSGSTCSYGELKKALELGNVENQPKSM